MKKKISSEQKEQLEDLVRETIMGAIYEDLNIDSDNPALVNDALDYLIKSLQLEKI